MHHKESRATLGGKLSAVLVAAGSSVGLGNIWRFPYVAGDNGGGAFLIIYILCVLLLGLPLMIAEFSVGRASHLNAVGAYRKSEPPMEFSGLQRRAGGISDSGILFRGFGMDGRIHGTLRHGRESPATLRPRSTKTSSKPSSAIRGGRFSTPVCSRWRPTS